MSAVVTIKKILKNIDFTNGDFIKNPSKYLNHLVYELKSLSPALSQRLSKALSCEQSDISEIEKIIMEINILISDNSSLKGSIEKLTISIDFLDGIGEKTGKALKKSGIYQLQDIILQFPYKYEVYDTDPSDGKIFITGVLVNKNTIKTKYGKSIYQASLKTEVGIYYGIWFNFSKKYPGPLLILNKEYSLYGKYTNFNGKPSVVHPQFVDKNDKGRIKPYYRLPSNVKNQSFAKIVRNALGYIGYQIVETLPEKILSKYDFPEIKNAVYTIHFPETSNDAALLNSGQHPAFRRFVYEELFYLQTGLLLKKLNYSKVFGINYKITNEYLESIKKYVPFKLTNAQKRVLADIFNDMKSDYQMNRLLQGDVGSGKTIVAFIAALIAVMNDKQVAIIAPTEVLAEQHYKNIVTFLQGDYNAAILTGSTSKIIKDEYKKGIEEGSIRFIVGTHAVIQEEISFSSLGFAIIDEQHRFGVLQRKSLVDKGYNPDILLMTATPIPRTLSLTFYGDLNVSVIDELPPGRTPVDTKSCPTKRFDDVLNFTVKELKKGNRAYFIYPLIEESEKLDLKDATAGYQMIKSKLSDFNIGLMHGRMKTEEKKTLMDDFKSGSIDVLVSTTVVEVGVDVPDATVIVVENAERFGLSQLHQLRGRVGRSGKKSYCYLVYSDKVSEEGKKRLDSMVETNDGFRLSEVDLEIRGPGDFFGTRQSGLPEFRFSNIVRDAGMLEKVRKDAEKILEDDPLLEKTENLIIKEMLSFKWKTNLDLTKIG